jgi:hypothetical protein
VECLYRLLYFRGMRRIDRGIAGKVLLLLLLLALIFQFVVLSGAIPLGMVWGGKLSDPVQGKVMALVAITIIVLMILVVMNRTGRFGDPLSRAGRIGIWCMFVLFTMNTVGNLAAEDLRETMIFTPVTGLLALLSLRLSLKEGPGDAAAG